MPTSPPTPPQQRDHAKDWRIPAGVLLTGTAIALIVVALRVGLGPSSDSGRGSDTHHPGGDEQASLRGDRKPVEEPTNKEKVKPEKGTPEPPRQPEKPTPSDEPQGGGQEDSKPPEKPADTLEELIANAKALKPGAIEKLAAVGAQAIPDILAELRRDDRRFSWATAAMSRMGPKAVGPVAELIDDNDHFMRKIAYLTLGQMGPIALPAVPALRRAVQQDGHPNNRGLAANAISQITRR